MRFIPFLLALSSTTAFALADGEEVFTLKKGESVSQVLWDHVAVRSHLYGAQGILRDVLKLNSLSLKKSKRLPVGSTFRVPRKYLKETIATTETELVPTPSPHQVPPPLPEPELLLTPEPVAEPVPAAVTLVHNFRLLAGSFLFNRNVFNDEVNSVSMQRFLQPVVGADHLLSGEKFNLSSMLLVTKHFQGDPDVPVEYNLNETLRWGHYLVHARYDHHAYYIGRKSDPEVEENTSVLIGGGGTFKAEVFKKETRFDLFYLRSLSSQSEGTSFTQNSFNATTSTPIDEKFALDFQLQFNLYSGSSEDLQETKALGLLGYRM